MIYTPLIWPLLVAGALYVGIALHVRRFWDVPGARSFAVMMALAGAWAILQAPYVSANSLPLKIALQQLQFAPIPFIPLAVLALAIEYTGRAHWLTRRRSIMLLIVPVITLLLAVTYDYHSLFRYNFRLGTFGPLPVLLSDRAPWYWFYVAYSYLLLLIAGGLLVTVGRVRPVYFWNTVAIVLAVFIPVVADMLYTAGLTPVPGYDPAPLTFVFTGGLLLWALSRFRMFSVAPVAWRIVINTIEDPVIVLDTRDHIVEYNRAAQTTCSLSQAQAIGASPDVLPPEWAELFRSYRNRFAPKEEVVIGSGGDRRVYELTISPIQDARARSLGRMFILHDITRRKQAEDALRESEGRFKLILDVAPVPLVLARLRDGTCRYANSLATEMVGIAPTEALGKPMVNFYVDPAQRTAIVGETQRTGAVHNVEVLLKRANGEAFWALMSAVLTHIDAEPVLLAGLADISVRKQAETALHERTLELESRNQELQAALGTIRTLSGLVPICAWCGRKIQDDKGDWVRVETYLQARSDVTFSHGMCPDCVRKNMAEVDALRHERQE